MGKLLTHRWVHVFLLLLFLLAAVSQIDSGQRWRQEMQFLVFDTLNRLYPRDPSHQVIIVDIDDDSLERIGQWPWPRTDLAALVLNLKELGAKVVAFDGVLAEPDRSSPKNILGELPKEEKFESLREEILKLPDNDEIMARAIKKSGIFVAGFTFGSYSQKPGSPILIKDFLAKPGIKKEFIHHSKRFNKAAVFLPGLVKASAGNGSFMATPEQDGVLRKTAMVFTDGRQLYPSLSLEALRVSLGDSKISTKIGSSPSSNLNKIDTDYRIVLRDYVIPVENDALLWVYYRPFSQEHDYISAHKILDKSFHEQVRSRIEGRIVFIGSSAEGLKDLRSTALQPFRPGVEIHANVAEQILQNKYLVRPNVTILAEAVFILLAGVLIIVMAPFIHVILLAVFCFIVMGFAFIGAASAYLEYGLLLDPFYPSLCVLAIFMISTILTYLRVETEKHQVREAFGLYISPDFLEELANNPDKLKLGGETRELTVMFSDIRRFTSICEGLSPEEIIQLMNDFLTPMSDLVMQNRGTIDKYMGDAMMAFWNAPLDDRDHARNACRTALGMQSALSPINKKIEERAKEMGKTPVLLNAGIGINTGPCSVGNMGSKQRFAYSALGDAVNIASRLEGQTKVYGVNIILGETTRKQIEGMAVLELDLLQVKGKKKPERIYTLVGDKEYASLMAYQKWAAIHAEMLQCYHRRDFKAVSKHIIDCREMAEGKLVTLYDLYERRAKDFIKSPPGDDWDGVIIAESK